MCTATPNLVNLDPSTIQSGRKLSHLINLLVSDQGPLILLSVKFNGIHKEMIFVEPSMAAQHELSHMEPLTIRDRIVFLLLKAKRDKQDLYFVPAKKEMVVSSQLHGKEYRTVRAGSIWVQTLWGYRALLDMVCESCGSIPWCK
jgi:hypothetical protein